MKKKKSEASIGVIHGRFQPLHLGHMEYLLAGKKRCDFLFVGITNSDPGMTATHPADNKRALRSANPFTYFERLLMIRDSMLEFGISRDEFEIVPFPINFPDKLKYYVPLDALFFVTIYDEWGDAKVDILKSLGLNVEVMWERNMSERFTTGKEVRNLIAKNGDWKELVPNSVADIINDLNLKEKVSNLLQNGDEKY